MANKKLTNKQIKFAQTYVKNGLNATQAYMKVYDCKKESTAKAASSRLLTNVNVKEYIAELTHRATESTKWTVEQIVDRLAQMALDDKQELRSWNREKEVVYKRSDQIRAAETVLKYKGVADGGGKEPGPGDGSGDDQASRTSFKDRVRSNVRRLRK